LVPRARQLPSPVVANGAVVTSGAAGIGSAEPVLSLEEFEKLLVEYQLTIDLIARGISQPAAIGPGCERFNQLSTGNRHRREAMNQSPSTNRIPVASSGDDDRTPAVLRTSEGLRTQIAAWAAKQPDTPGFAGSRRTPCEANATNEQNVEPLVRSKCCERW
jgi:hypothetical protein